jgi:ABC-type glycerol-3-phosphate transport system substrate-binding protein
LPADSRDGALLGLQFYLAEGGRVMDEAGQSILEPEPLARALANIGLRKDNLLQSHQLKTLDEAWQYHQLGLSDFMWTRVEYWLGLQAADPRLVTGHAYSAVPGVSGPLPPLTTSWVWAITTGDPARQALAGELITSLTSVENMAAWSGSSQMLPARRGAMALLAGQNPYYQFAGEESERALAMPISETSRVMDVLGDAVFQVLTTDTSPVLIAEQAATSLRQ